MDLLIRHSEPSDFEAARTIHAGPNVIAGTLPAPFPSLELWRKRSSEPGPDTRMRVAVADVLPGQFLIMSDASSNLQISQPKQPASARTENPESLTLA